MRLSRLGVWPSHFLFYRRCRQSGRLARNGASALRSSSRAPSGGARSKVVSHPAGNGTSALIVSSCASGSDAKSKLASRLVGNSSSSLRSSSCAPSDCAKPSRRCAWWTAPHKRCTLCHAHHSTAKGRSWRRVQLATALRRWSPREARQAAMQNDSWRRARSVSGYVR